MSTKRGLKRAAADVGLMFTALNLRRLMNIIDKNKFETFLKELALLWFAQTNFFKQILMTIVPFFFIETGISEEFGKIQVI